jgi:hypothetical protein
MTPRLFQPRTIQKPIRIARGICLPTEIEIDERFERRDALPAFFLEPLVIGIE